MVDLLAMSAELKLRTAYQKTPQPLDEKEYIAFIIVGLRDLYIVTGRAGAYNDDLFTIDENGVPTEFATDLLIDEYEFVLAAAEIAFYQKVQADVNNIVGYSTDALSVTNADKPYQYLAQTINECRKRRNEYYYKMPRYNQL